MCKVYNQIGSLTTIKSHLSENHINDFTSIRELINFQTNYSTARNQITSDHRQLIEQEKNTLNAEIDKLKHSFDEKRTEVEQELLSELNNLKIQLSDLELINSNIFKTLINYVKKIVLKQKIHNNELHLNFNIEQSLEYLTNDRKKKDERYQYIISRFDDAVLNSSQSQIQQFDRKKKVIDQINNSIYGALGEQKVVNELEKLADDHILINDFICHFQPPIYNSQEKDYIKSVQIDHILVSPSGVF